MTPTFCILPWMQSSIEASGEMRICCNSKQGINQLRRHDGTVYKISDADALDSWHSETLVTLRAEMLDGKKPAACEKCYREDANNINSPRAIANKKWMFNFEPTSRPSRTIKYIDMRLGNLCNLKCRMCYPGASSQWIDEYHLINPKFKIESIDPNMAKWPNDGAYLNTIRQVADDLEEIYLTGGEPTLASSQYELYDYLIERDLAKNIALAYNTNCTNLQPKMVEYWKHFRAVDLDLSIDAIGSLHRYIRHPASWELVEKNVLQYKKLNDDGKIWITISPTVQNYSIFHMNLLIDYFTDIGLQDRIWFNLLDNPPHLNIRSLPKSLKEMLTDRYKSYPTMEKIIDYMNNEDWNDKYWKEFVHYTKTLDVSRNENILVEIPELIGYL